MKNNKVVKVFNRNTFAVFAKGINRGYKFEAAQGGRAASIPLAWEDIEYINDNTELFREGYLSFSDTESAELHKELGNFNIEKTAYTPERIRDAILNPTYDKMKAIIDITSMGMIERFRGDLIYLRESGDQPVSSNVERIIEERYREIYNGKYRSAINLKQNGNNSDDAVDAKTAELEAKIARLEAMMTGKTVQSEEVVSATDFPSAPSEQPVVAEAPAQEPKATKKTAPKKTTPKKTSTAKKS